MYVINLQSKLKHEEYFYKLLSLKTYYKNGHTKKYDRMRDSIKS